jgi:hypothetical protein
VLAAITGSANAQHGGPADAAASASSAPRTSDVVLPLSSAVSLRVDSRVAKVRQITERAFAAHFSGDATEAVLLFREAQQADSNCVLCVWGEAVALAPSVLAADRAGDTLAAAAATARAAARLARRPRDASMQRFVDALIVRHFGPPGTRAARDTAYAMQMALLANARPESTALQLLAADAMWLAARAAPEMAVTPGRPSLQALARERLEGALTSSPARAVACRMAHAADSLAASWMRRHCFKRARADRAW